MRYLTKSRFKLGLECPTKLHYAGKPDKYFDANSENDFLKHLASGGYQVGALAKFQYPEGIEIEGLDHVTTIQKTEELLGNENVTMFEAAVKYQNLFVRIDVLKKHKNNIELIEVKSKSFDPKTIEDELWNKNEIKKNRYQLNSKWVDYVYDLAFQTYVLSKAYPQYKITSKLLLADKTKIASIDGLSQLFKVKRDGKQIHIITPKDLTKNNLGLSILTSIDLTYAVDKILVGEEKTKLPTNESFEDFISTLAAHYSKDEKFKPLPGPECKRCQFNCPSNLEMSGLHECWSEFFHQPKQDLSRPLITELWDNRNVNLQIEQGYIFLEDLEIEVIESKSKKNKSTTNSHIDNENKKNETSHDLFANAGLGRVDRQLLQIKCVQEKLSTAYLDLENLGLEMSTWKYPWSFIDFETSLSALPFHSGRKPYENVAFQFSYHLMNNEGHIQHVAQYLNDTPGKFPNFDFVRSLKSALENYSENGTIFRYATHEKTILNQIKDQLKESDEIDRHELISWIEEFQDPMKSRFVDLLKVVKKYYYHPKMKGSNSLKYVLPSILESSSYLQEKYSHPIYGTKNMKSLNFKDKIWITKDDAGKIIDPYEQLPLIYQELDLNHFESAHSKMEDQTLKNGSAAMMAYSILQFIEISPEERNSLSSALLRYCELDTLAMAMLAEYWREESMQYSKVQNHKGTIGKKVAS
jgi:hypothetical protein